MNFHECIQRFFTSKMQEKLITDFTVNNENKLEFSQSQSGKDFFRLFSTQQLFSPELVWNDETRREMLAKLQLQLKSMLSDKEGLPTEVGFCNVVRDFEYSVNQKELRI